MQWGLKLPWQAPLGNSAPGRPRARARDHPAWIRAPASPPGLSGSVWEVTGAPWLYQRRGSVSARRGRGGARATSPQCTVLSAASRPPPSHVQMRSGRPCPDVPLPLCCPDAHSAARRPDVRALVPAAPNEVQMFGLARAGGGGGYQRRGRPWEGGAGLQLDARCWRRNAPGRIPAGMRARWLCLNKDLASPPAASQAGRSAPPGGAAPCTGLQPSLRLLNNFFFFFCNSL